MIGLKETFLQQQPKIIHRHISIGSSSECTKMWSLASFFSPAHLLKKHIFSVSSNINTDHKLFLSDVSCLYILKRKPC